MEWALIPTMLLIHRVRGGLLKMPVWVPVKKSTYWIWPFVGLAAWLCGMTWLQATLWAVGYLIWILPGWMEEIDQALGQKPAGQVTSNGLDVRLVFGISMGHKHLACIVRAALYLIPLCIAMPYVDQDPAFLLIIVLTFWPAYWLGSKRMPSNLAMVAESLVGASWGLSMVLAVLLPLGL